VLLPSLTVLREETPLFRLNIRLEGAPTLHDLYETENAYMNNHIPIVLTGKDGTKVTIDSYPTHGLPYKIIVRIGSTYLRRH